MRSTSTTTTTTTIRRRLRALISGIGPDQGDEAPAWDVLAVPGGRISLADQRGSWVVLYFYPKADTPGCTAQACSLRDDFLPEDVALFGASTDFPDSLRVFRSTYALTFPLLSDPRGELARRYGVLRWFGRHRVADRATFIIDPNGRIARVLHGVQPQTHGSELTLVLAELRA